MFNRSQHIISFGSPDIVPIFCGALPHSTWNTYPHEFEDFATGLITFIFPLYKSYLCTIRGYVWPVLFDKIRTISEFIIIFGIQVFNTEYVFNIPYLHK